MKGLEIAKAYYEQYGKAMLEGFPELLPYIAVGFVGNGSDRYGFDDEISQDHDFEPGFNIFIPGEDIVDRKAAFQLERAYDKLPKEFMGFKKGFVSPVGGNRNGVKRISEFYDDLIGCPDGNLTEADWMRLPSYALFDATNGEIFFDNYGEFTAIREKLMDMPRDIWLKKIAGNLLLMAQSGQYNYMRCIKHGEFGASELAVREFVDSTMKVLFLLSGKYMPYYKWSFRSLRGLFGYSEFADRLESLLSGDIKEEGTADRKFYEIEGISADVIDILMSNELTEATCGDLEKHAYSVNDQIKDGNLRNMNIFAAV